MLLNKKQIEAILNEYKDTSSGKYGDAFERVVKIYFNGKRGNWNKVASKGHTDMTWHGFTFEVKSNCGQLDINDLLKKDFVIYSDNNTSDIFNVEVATVMTSSDFLKHLKECGLLRTKTYTNGKVGYAIQSYKNSLKKSMLWHATTMDNHNTIEEFKVLYKDTYK